MVGSATLTTVSSTMVISVAAHSSASASSRLRGIETAAGLGMIQTVADRFVIDDLF